MASAAASPMAGREKRVLVIGVTGDGKSTLIDNLRDPARSAQPKAGMDKNGVTKHITMYPGRPIGNVRYNLLDTPGVGDHEIPPMDLMVLLEQVLTDSGVIGGVDLVIVTTLAFDSRVKIGAQLVKILVEKGFVGGNEKWKNIVLVGTKKDRAKEEELEYFVREIVPDFFGTNVPQAFMKFALVSHEDYTPLLNIIRDHMPETQVQYRRPPPEEMAQAMAKKLGFDIGEFAQLLPEMRRAYEAQAQELQAVLQRTAAEREQFERTMQQSVEQREEERKAHHQRMAELERRAQESDRQQAEQVERLKLEHRDIMERQERKMESQMQQLTQQHQQTLQSMQMQLQSRAAGSSRNNLAEILGPLFQHVLGPAVKAFVESSAPGKGK